MQVRPGQYHLFVDPLAAAEGPFEAPSGTPGTGEPLRVPEQPAGLVIDPACGPRIAGGDGDDRGPLLLLEPVRAGSRVVLVAAGPPAQEIRLNGHPLPRVALLSPGDSLLVPGGWRLKVALYRRPTVVKAGADGAGKACPLCRTPIDPRDDIYICATCSASIHWRSAPEREGEDPLECARTLSECPACTSPVVLEEGYVGLEEEDRDA